MRRLRTASPRIAGNRPLLWVVGGLAALVVAVALFLSWFSWDRMRGPIARFASARMHRAVSIDGHLKVHLLTWSPAATVEGLRIAQPAWAGTGDMIAMKSATVSVRLPRLLRGELVLPIVDLETPRFDFVRAADGRANWQFSDKPSAKPMKLPPIRQFIINGGAIRYADRGKKLLVSGVIEAHERQSGAYRQGFHLDGRGTTNGNPFVLSVVGGPLINIDKSRPYPFSADVRGGSSRIVANGSITRPFNFGQFTTTLKLSGPDLAQLYDLTGLTLPNTPPYNLTGRLSRDDTLFRFENIGGRVGDSDLGGQLSVETKTHRLDLNADLHSKRLDLDDLMALFGGAPDTRETVSANQKTLARALVAEQRLLPDAPLQAARLRSMDAKVRYRAQSVRSDALPVRTAAVDILLKDGILDLKPFVFKLVSGQLDGSARIDARKDLPVTDIDARLRDVGLQQFLSGKGEPMIEGAVQARAKLHGAGLSVHRAAANADGSISVVVPRGRIRQAFAELLGINAGKGLYMLLSKDQRQTDLRCAVADFKVKGGVARAQTFVVDTDVVTSFGTGSLDLGKEQVDFVLDGKSKKPRLLHLWAPISIRGPVRSPKLGVQPTRIAAQAGIGVALGALLTPLGAILPFIDPGLAKDADCAGLIAGSGAGAPVRAAGR